MIGSIYSKGIISKKYYLYFQKKSNNQIIGIHENSKNSHKLLNIPFVYEFNNGINSFKDYKHMINSDNTSKKGILNHFHFQSNCLKMILSKNAQYRSNDLKFEYKKSKDILIFTLKHIINFTVLLL